MFQCSEAAPSNLFMTSLENENEQNYNSESNSKDRDMLLSDVEQGFKTINKKPLMERFLWHLVLLLAAKAEKITINILKREKWKKKTTSTLVNF